MYRKILTIIKENKISYKQFLKYYKYALKMQDKEFLELLSSIIPYDLKDYDDEKFYEIQGVIKYKLMYNHYRHY